ncbi:MAG: hypothetical protein IT450_07155 [Phycisphaerales bacterium]|nr:hypothetical protein [Phycisphaerales bacterium]
MQPDIPGALQELDRVAKRIEELLEWNQLAQDERRTGIPPSFQFRDHIGGEIVSLYSAFLVLSRTVHRVLDRELPEPHSNFRLELSLLEERVAGWQIGTRFIYG